VLPHLGFVPHKARGAFGIRIRVLDGVRSLPRQGFPKFASRSNATFDVSRWTLPKIRSE